MLGRLDLHRLDDVRQVPLLPNAAPRDRAALHGWLSVFPTERHVHFNRGRKSVLPASRLVAEYALQRQRLSMWSLSRMHTNGAGE